MYVDINKVEVILRVGTGGVESESGGWRVRQGRGGGGGVESEAEGGVRQSWVGGVDSVIEGKGVSEA